MYTINYLNEVWKPVRGYVGLYEVSNYGRVKSNDRYVKTAIDYNTKRLLKGKLLKQGLVSGYKRMDLCKEGTVTHHFVHRLVWEAFNDPIPEGMQVNHINEDKTDNRLENLNLMTPKENINWGTGPCRRSKRMTNRPDQSKSVVQLNLEGTVIKDDWPSTMEVERVLKYNNSKISECCLGKRKTYKGFIWRYKEKGG